MASKSYLELLRDPRWQRKRLEVLQRDEWRCQSCYDDKATLHVHHRYYRSGLKPWEYEADCYRTLCESCHEDETKLKRRLDAVLPEIFVRGMGHVVLGFMEALVACETYGGDGVVKTEPFNGHAAGIWALLLASKYSLRELISPEDLDEIASRSGGAVNVKEISAALNDGTWAHPPRKGWGG